VTTLARGPAPACRRAITAGHRELTGQPGLRGVSPASSARQRAGPGTGRGNQPGAGGEVWV